MKKPEKLHMENKKASIIVLAAAALIFAAAVFLIYSQDFLNGIEEHFTANVGGFLEFEKGTVLEILSEDVKQEEAAEGHLQGNQKLSVVIRSGRYKGEIMTASNYFGAITGVPLEVGDSVIFTVKTHDDGSHIATVYEFNRLPTLIVCLILFFAVIILVGGRTGLKSLIGLIFTAVCLFVILIPLLLKGAPTVVTTVLVCAYMAAVSFTVLGGVHRKTVSAFLGTMAGVLIALIFGLAAQHFAKIDGFRLDTAEELLQMRYYDSPLRLKGLLVASLIVSALGAVMDVAMSISSSLEEVHAANPAMTGKELFRSGMNIGHDMAGTMTNTLILAFLGCEFSLIIFFYAQGLTFRRLVSTPFVGIQAISSLASSIGMILAIPLTALISSVLISGKGQREKTAGQRKKERRK
ncbi:MAG: YibE/F family protein [Oscillospiraceae bacterium]|nr:YibE/F family protein [Oscillospiraceae bacterium]